MNSWRRPVALIVVCTAVVVLLMAVSGMGPEIPLIVALGLLAGVAFWVVSDLRTNAVGSMGLPSAEARPPATRPDRRVLRLRSGLVHGRHDEASLEHLRESLVELIDDQLLAVHQIDRATDPAAARAVLGGDLAAFVDDPSTAHRLDKPRFLAHTVTLIERL